MPAPALPELLKRYDAACDAYTKACGAHQWSWHLPDVEEFSELFELLTKHALAGDAEAQYAVASMLLLGLRCQSEQEHLDIHADAVMEASIWWELAAKQGHLPAIDNLLTCGVGAEAERVRRVAEQVKQEQPELVARTGGMPCLGPRYFAEVAKRSYGVVNTGSDQALRPQGALDGEPRVSCHPR